MRDRNTSSYVFLSAAVLLFAGILLAQDAPDRSLLVNGKDEGTVVQIDGHAYVDIETIARFTKGSVTIEPNRVMLTFPAPGTNVVSETAAPSAESAPASGLSRTFASQAIGELAEMREWRGAVGAILTYGAPVVGSWPQDYHDHVEANLKQVQVAASTEADGKAMQLLQNEFSNLERWANDVVTTRQAMNATNTVRPDVVQNDPTVTKITSCSRFLSSMLVGGFFADDSSCH